jgi:hypothetical protein
MIVAPALAKPTVRLHGQPCPSLFQFTLRPSLSDELITSVCDRIDKGEAFRRVQNP